jgi:hypothetical protein
MHFTLPSPQKALLGAIAAIACAFGATGCVAAVEAEPVYYASGPAVVDEQVAWVDAPADVETYPCETYGGTTVYLVSGRWYARSPRGWYYYRREPVELGRRRVVYESSPSYSTYYRSSYHPAAPRVVVAPSHPTYYRPAPHPAYRAPAVVHVSHGRRGRG